MKIRAIRAAINGPSECGKSFLASGFTIGQWAHEKRRSIVFDPWKGRKRHAWSTPTNWGPGAWVSNDFERWKRAALNTEGCCVVWDEGTTNGGRGRENIELFTAIRHNHPVFIFLGHRFDAMLPVMRGSLTDLYLAKSTEGDAKQWAAERSESEIMTAPNLVQYEFLHSRSFQPVRRLKYSPDEIAAGLKF